MSTLFLFLGFFCFITIAFLIEKKLPQHLKNYSFVCSLSLISIVLYWLTFIVNFFHAQYFLYAVSAGVLLHDGQKHKFRNFKIFYHTHKLIFILSGIWFLLTFQVQILQWDDFSWGSFVKHLNHFGSYWNSHSAILVQGLRYFPGISLWESFFTGRDFYNEQALFFSLGLIFVSVIHHCLPKNLDAKKTFYFVVLFLAPISWFTVGIGTISTETTMALLLGAALCATLDVQKAEDLFVPFIIALYLAITKETGFLLAMLIVLLVALQSCRKKMFFSTWILFCFFCLGMMFFDFQLWQIYLKKDPLLSVFNSSATLDQLIKDLGSLSDKSKTILTTFFQALIDRPMGRSYLSRLPIPYFSYLKGFYLFWALIIALTILSLKNRWEYFVTYIWGLLGYTAVLVVTFLYVFGDYEGFILASYERYMGVYFLAFAILAVKIIYQEKLMDKKYFLYPLIALIVLMPPSPKILYPASIKFLFAGLVPEKYQHRLDQNVRVDLLEIKNKIQTLTPENSKVWMICQYSTGYEAMILRYEIIPRKMNVAGWSLGTPYYTGDVWTQDFESEDFVKKLHDYDYVAVFRVDENFTKKYGVLFKTPPTPNSLYKKEFINGTFRLTEIK